jgi:hypothetical protein
VNAVSPTRVASDDVKMPVLLELCALLGRQPFGQKPAAPGVGRVLAKEAPVEFAERVQARSRRRAEPECRDHEQFRSTADEAGIEQRFMRGRVERSDPSDFAGPGSERRSEANSGQFPKALLCSRQRFGILRIKLVARIASLVHHDLGSHVESPHAQPST